MKRFVKKVLIGILLLFLCACNKENASMTAVITTEENSKTAESFVLGNNLRALLENMAVDEVNFEATEVTEKYFADRFLIGYCQDSRLSFDYLEKVKEENNGMLLEEQAEYILYSMSMEHADLADYMPNKGIKIHEDTSRTESGKIISYETEVHENGVTLIAEFEKVINEYQRLRIYEVKAELVKNAESCFDGYSIKTLKTEDVTPILYGDNRYHSFYGRDLGYDNCGVFTLEGCTGDNNIRYDRYVYVDLSENKQMAEFVRENAGKNFKVTYRFESTLTQPVNHIIPTRIELLEDSLGTQNIPTQEDNVVEIDPAIYVGEYNSYDVDEPDLEIRLEEDGTYTIQIGIYRTAYMTDGVGKMTSDGIQFVITAPSGNPVHGLVTVEEDIATVTFLNEEWDKYNSGNTYQYYKVSNATNIDMDYEEEFFESRGVAFIFGSELKETICEAAIDCIKTPELKHGIIASYETEIIEDEVIFDATMKAYDAEWNEVSLYKLDAVLVKDMENGVGGYCIKSLTTEEITPDLSGDNKVHCFTGRYTGYVDYYTKLPRLEDCEGDEGIRYSNHINVDVSKNEELADFLEDNKGEYFEITYLFDDSMMQPVYWVVPIDIKLVE